MELNKQVTSLEISKRLKELGVRQESLFYWVDNKVHYQNNEETLSIPPTSNEYPAFTVAELGELLPSVNTQSWQTWSDEESERWKCQNWKNNKGISICADTEADARGKMLIYLLENKLIEA